MFLDHPWTGVGVGLFGYHSPDYGLSFFIYVREFGIRMKQVHSWIEAHSSLFHILATMGIPGFAAWAFLLWTSIRTITWHKNVFPSLAPAEKPWAVALQSYAFVAVFYLFIGSGLGHFGIDAPRIEIFMMWLAVMSVRNTLRHKTIRRVSRSP